MIRFSGLSSGIREMMTTSAARIALIATTKTSKSRMILSIADSASIQPSLRLAITTAGAVEVKDAAPSGRRPRPFHVKRGGRPQVGKAAESVQARPSLAKQNQAKKLGFAWFYSSESGLFNGLQRKK